MENENPLQASGFEAHAISIFDKSNPRSVINLLPDRMRKTVETLPPKYRNMDERKARGLFRPSPAMNQLRSAFWLEYNRTQTVHRPHMDMAPIFSGIVTKDYFEDVVCASKEMIAWMIIPPRSYQALLDEAWDAGMGQMREILELPHV